MANFIVDWDTVKAVFEKSLDEAYGDLKVITEDEMKGMTLVAEILK